MSAQTSIEWCDRTYNPWQGCTKKSPGCAHCYAETRDARHLYEKVDHWGIGAPRLRPSDAYLRQPLRWNREAGRGEFGQCWTCGRRGSFPQAGAPCPQCSAVNTHHYHDRQSGEAVRPRVFSLSMGDWLDDEVPIEWLADFLQTIHATPNLDWLLLTKRPENWEARIVSVLQHLVGPEPPEPDTSFYHWLMDWRCGVPERTPANVWIGTSVEDQARADERLPLLLQIPARVRFLSCEPLLESVDLDFACFNGADSFGSMPGVHWVICGGESGPKARPMHPEWARNLRDQCAVSGVPFLFKQWGSRPPLSTTDGRQELPFGEYVLPTTDNPEGFGFLRSSKSSAGRLLDGVLHDAFPQPLASSRLGGLNL
jgi:protein gp37